MGLESTKLNEEWENGRRKGKGLLMKNNKFYEGSWKNSEHRWWGRISQYHPDDCCFTLLYTGEIQGNKPEVGIGIN